MNYLQTINSLNPNRLFTFGNYTNFISYNGRDISGSIFDDISGALMTPTFLPLMKSPDTIRLFSPSVTNNEISNQGLVIGSNDIDNPYGINFKCNGTTNNGNNSSLSFQIRVPQQRNNGAIRITDLDRVSATITYTDKKTGDILTAYRECTIYGKRWFIQFVGIRPLLGTVLDVSFSYKNQVIHTDTIVMNSKLYINTEIPPETVPLFSTEMLTDKIGDGKPSYFGGYMNNFRNNQRLLFGVYDYLDEITGETSKMLPENGGELVFHGEYNEPINARSYQILKNLPNAGTNNIEVMRLSDIRIHTIGNRLYVYNLSTPIEYNKNYNVVITVESFADNDGKINIMLFFYLNNVLIGNTNLNKVDNFRYSSLDSSTIEIGTKPNIRGKENFYDDTTRDVYFERDTGSCYIDNISTFQYVLSPESIHKLYIRGLTYRELLLENPVTYYTEFDNLKKSYISFNNSKEFISYNMERKSVSFNNEIYPTGVNFKGNGNLKLKNESSYNSSANMINFNNSFSIVMWIKTTSKDFVLYSEREKQHPSNGFSIIVDKGGRITYQYGKQSYNSNCIINDGRFKMLCISYNASTYELITYIPSEYRDSGILTPLNNAIGTHRYITMFSDNNKIENVDVSLGALGFFGSFIKPDFYDDLFREKVDFSVSGYVAFKNLPTNAIIRVLNHDSGKLITELKTDKDGAFRFDSIYKNDVDLIVHGDDGYVQCLGTITAETIIWNS